MFFVKLLVYLWAHCAPFLANLYLYALEYKFLEQLTHDDIDTARRFSN